MTPYVEVKQVSKQYSGADSEALHGVSFTLQPGQILGLLGHNGAGKSTLIKALLGAHRCHGEVAVLGYNPVQQREKVMEHLAYISDVNVLPQWMTVKQLLRYTAGVHPKFDLDKAYSVLEQTEIKPGAKISALSKGMQVQLHLTLVIATDTKVLILDEPTLGLDLIYRETFYRHLLEWFHDGQRSLIIASHEVAEIEHLLTDVLILKQGKVVLQQSMAQIEQGYLVLEAPSSLAEQIAQYQPLFSETGLGTTRWLIESCYRPQLEAMGRIYTVKLADLFLALQKENR